MNFAHCVINWGSILQPNHIDFCYATNVNTQIHEYTQRWQKANDCLCEWESKRVNEIESSTEHLASGNNFLALNHRKKAEDVSDSTQVKFIDWFGMLKRIVFIWACNEPNTWFTKLLEKLNYEVDDRLSHFYDGNVYTSIVVYQLSLCVYVLMMMNMIEFQKISFSMTLLSMSVILRTRTRTHLTESYTCVCMIEFSHLPTTQNKNLSHTD